MDKCECYIEHDIRHDTYKTVYCHMHGAARALLEALQHACAVMAVHPKVNARHIAIAVAAIRAAKGETAS